MVSALDGNRSQDLHLSLRLSVCEGVRVMYHSYQNKKWSKVLTIFSFVINSLCAKRCVCIIGLKQFSRTGTKMYSYHHWTIHVCENPKHNILWTRNCSFKFISRGTHNDQLQCKQSKKEGKDQELIQSPHLPQDTNWKVTMSQLDITNESQEVSPFPAGDHKASTNRIACKHNKTRQK